MSKRLLRVINSLPLNFFRDCFLVVIIFMVVLLPAIVINGPLAHRFVFEAIDKRGVGLFELETTEKQRIVVNKDTSIELRISEGEMVLQRVGSQEERVFTRSGEEGNSRTLVLDDPYKSFEVDLSAGEYEIVRESGLSKMYFRDSQLEWRYYFTNEEIARKNTELKYERILLSGIFTFIWMLLLGAMNL